MLEVFFPDIYVKSIYEIPLDKFKTKGIKALFFDIDNTIVPYDVVEPDDKIVSFFKNLKEMGFKICLISNNNKNRVNRFNKKLNVHAIARAGKPGIKKLIQAMKKLGEDPESSAFIGDQAFTDMYCGNKAGMLTVLTRPVCNRDQLVTKVKRGIERVVLNIYFKKYGIER